MYTIFPKFFYGPTFDIHPELKSVYMNQISEFTPLFSKLDRFPNSAMVAWGLAFLTLPISLVYLTHSTGQKRFVWAFTALLIFVYLCLALYQKRWLSYAQLLSVIPLAQLWSKILQWQKLYVRGGIRPMIRSLTLVFFCLVPLVLIFSTADQREPSLLGQEEFSQKLCLYLNDKQVFGESPMRILTSIYIGPLILYQTEHEVIGTPAHRNERGILDTAAIMKAVNNETAHQIIEKRGINAILIGRPDRGLYDYLIPEAKTKGKFYHRLWYGPVPDWLEFQPVPKEFDQKIKLFKVRHPVIIK
jgi:hypothetical protein